MRQHLSMACSLCLHLPYSFLLSSLSLFWQETALILTRCHGFSFFFFSRDVAVSQDKSLRCISGKCRTDGQYSVITKATVHSFLGICSGFINFLRWLNCTLNLKTIPCLQYKYNLCNTDCTFMCSLQSNIIFSRTFSDWNVTGLDVAVNYSSSSGVS